MKSLQRFFSKHFPNFIVPTTIFLVSSILLLESGSTAATVIERAESHQATDSDHELIDTDTTGSVPKKGTNLKHNFNPNYNPNMHNRVGAILHNKNWKNKGDIVSGGYHSSRKTTTTTTEPDWDYICYVLCKRGEGGLACNCDILPVG